MAQNLIVGLILIAAVTYLTVAYIRKRQRKTGCSHCAVANVQAANVNRDKPRSEK